MSNELINRCFAHSRSTGTGRVILLALANRSQDKGAWPSVKTLARDANCGERNVRKQLEILVALGELDIVINGGYVRGRPKHMRTNLYQITLTCPPGECNGGPSHSRALDDDMDEGGVPIWTGSGAHMYTDPRPEWRDGPKENPKASSPSEKKQRERASSTPRIPAQGRLRDRLLAAIRLEMDRSSKGDPDADVYAHNLRELMAVGDLERAWFWWFECLERAPLPGELWVGQPLS